MVDTAQQCHWWGLPILSSSRLQILKPWQYIVLTPRQKAAAWQNGEEKRRR
jgi:hypothetical protein